jgi:hypothetical protein
MGRYSYVVLTSAREGRENEFRRWYDDRHLDDVRKIPGIVAARRMNVIKQIVNNMEAPQWHSLAIYEIEAEDPDTVLQAISAVSDTEAMPLSPALNKFGLIQVLAEPVYENEK